MMKFKRAILDLFPKYLGAPPLAARPSLRSQETVPDRCPRTYYGEPTKGKNRDSLQSCLWAGLYPRVHQSQETSLPNFQGTILVGESL